MDRTVTADVSEDLILWDVVEEHLDEADFLYGQWRRALDSPLYTIDSLAKGPESRMLAHVDGLVVNGPAVAERLLLPVLRAPEEPSETRACAASLALIGLGRHDAVVEALLQADAVTSEGAEHALALAAPAAFDAWLPGALARGFDRRQRAALLRVAAARGHSLPNLLLYLQSSDAEEAAAAADAAVWSDPVLHGPVLEYLLDDPRPAVANAVLTTALVHGSRSALARCLERAGDATRADGLAMLLTALLGTPAHHEMLTGHLARETHRKAALFALGYAGQAAVIPTLLAQLETKDPPTRKLTAEAIGTITGLDTAADAFVSDLPVPESEALPSLEEDLAADLVPTEVDALPEPNVAAIMQWWSEQGGRMDARRRLLLGAPWTYEHALHTLGSLSMRRRAPAVTWLLLCSGGRAKIGARAFAAMQRAQANAAERLSAQALARRFGSW